MLRNDTKKCSFWSCWQKNCKKWPKQDFEHSPEVIIAIFSINKKMKINTTIDHNTQTFSLLSLLNNGINWVGDWPSESKKYCRLEYQAIITSSLPFWAHFSLTLWSRKRTCTKYKLIINLNQNVVLIPYLMSYLANFDSFRSYVSTKIGSYCYYYKMAKTHKNHVSIVRSKIPKFWNPE